MVLRPKYFEFTHTSADWSSGELTFSYKTELENGDIHEFTEKLILPEPVDSSLGEDPAIQKTLQMIHFSLGPSYFKAYGPTEIRHPYTISQKEANYWNILYTEGMGEYYYVNNLDFKDRVAFPYSDGYQSAAPSAAKMVSNRALVLHGGGKDSIVSVEIVKKAGVDFDLFAVNDSSIQQAVADVMGKKIETIHRTIDAHLIELNKSGEVYDGHVPISAVYASLAVLYAAIYGYRYVIVSNESSAMYGNIEYKGITVNHQWSKSLYYENLFRDYIQSNVSSHIEFFSLLRPIAEIHIAQIFSHYPEYFEAFSSSNHNFTIDPSGKKRRWSVDYSKGKVEFVWAILSAFLSRSDMLRIFEEDIYARTDVLDKFKELVGVKDIKPLECVGTPEEMKVAMYMAYKQGDFNDTPVMSYFISDILPELEKNIESMQKEVFAYEHDENIPPTFKEALSAIMKLQ